MSISRLQKVYAKCCCHSIPSDSLTVNGEQDMIDEVIEYLCLNKEYNLSPDVYLSIVGSTFMLVSRHACPSRSLGTHIHVLGAQFIDNEYKGTSADASSLPLSHCDRKVRIVVDPSKFEARQQVPLSRISLKSSVIHSATSSSPAARLMGDTLIGFHSDEIDNVRKDSVAVTRQRVVSYEHQRF